METRKNKIVSKNKFVAFIYKYKAWSFILFIILPFAIFKIVQKERNWYELGRRGQIVQALICEKEFFLSKRGDSYKYYYCFNLNGVLYKEGVMYNYSGYNLTLNIGDTIEISYLPDDPNVNIDLVFLKNEHYLNLEK